MAGIKVLVFIFISLFHYASSAPTKARSEEVNPKAGKSPVFSHINSVGRKRDYVVERNFNDAVTVNDIKRKLSVIHIRAENVCYLSRIETRTQTIKSKMDNSSQSRAITIWTIQKEFNLRSVLSKKMARLCSRSSIYWVHKNAETTTQSLDIGNTRSRRSVCSSKICKTRPAGFYKNNGRMQWSEPKLICLTVKNC